MDTQSVSIENSVENLKKSIISNMISDNATDQDRLTIIETLSKFPIEIIEMSSDAGTKIRVLRPGEKYRKASPALNRFGVDVDAWPVAPRGLFVLEEKTLYIRTVSVMTIGHEFCHSVDLALGINQPLGKDLYLSSTSSKMSQIFNEARAFVTPYAASGKDEFFAESLRAYVGNLNDRESLWPKATPERLKELTPEMSAFFDEIIADLSLARQAMQSLPMPPPEAMEAPKKNHRRNRGNDRETEFNFWFFGMC